MQQKMRVTLEVGPKGKKVVAVAPDWPGLERGAKSDKDAIEKLRTYLARYAKVARLARLGAEYPTSTADLEVVEQYRGTGSTDFWGISFAFSTIDEQMTSVELRRQLSLMRACWQFFDDVRARVSAEMHKGPRGGGRDRDEIVRHVLAVEQDWAKKVGVRHGDGGVLTDANSLTRFRNAYGDAIRAAHVEGRAARTWPLRYLIRHTAYHTMDHAWEMEDKDTTTPNS